MNDFNRYNGHRRRAKKSRTPLWVRLLDLVIFILSAATIVSLLIAYMSQYVDPNRGWIFATMGLLAPIIYVVGVATSLYWIIRWRWMFAIALIVVLGIGANKVSLVVKVPFKRHYDTENYRGTVKVMSYNVRGLRNDEWQSSKSDVVAYIKEHRPDIICMQEVIDKHIFDSINYAGQYSKYVHKELAIYSRYPIVSSGVNFEQANWASGNSIYVDLVIQGDTIRVFNNHLHSTSIKREDNDYLTSTQVVRDSHRSTQLSDIVQRLQNNTIERVEQVERVAQQIASTPYEMIVCGDFNETPISYTYNTLSKGLSDSFRLCGDNYSYTFRGFFNLLRIDYILTSERITPRSYLVDREMTVSDHLPVIVRVKINKQL